MQPITHNPTALLTVPIPPISHQPHLTQNGITVMEWPACSPDMNPIEHLWDQLKQRIGRQVQNNTTLAQLEQIAIQQWNAIPMHRIRRLIRSMTTRVRECVQSNGAYTHYWLVGILNDDWLVINNVVTHYEPFVSDFVKQMNLINIVVFALNADFVFTLCWCEMGGKGTVRSAVGLWVTDCIWHFT